MARRSRWVVSEAHRTKPRLRWLIEHEVDDYIAGCVAARDGVHLTNGEQQSRSEQEREKEEAREPVAARASGAGIRRNKLRIGLRAPPDDRRRSAGLAAPRRGDRYDERNQ